MWRRATSSSISSSSIGCRSITSIFLVSFGVVVVRINGMAFVIISFTCVCSWPSCCLVPASNVVVGIRVACYHYFLGDFLGCPFNYFVVGVDISCLFSRYASSNFSLSTVFSRSYFLVGVDFGVVFDINLQTTLLGFSVGVDVSWLVGDFLVGVVVWC